METVFFLYLDRYHQSDPLFVRELAQRFARAGTDAPPTLILHTGGEKLERTLEAEGVFPERRDGVLQVETPRQQALAERAVREANQELMAAFTDEVVSAVGVQGSDRGLLRRGEDGAVTAGAAGWVEDLIKMRVVPVVSALAEGPSRAEEVAPARAAVALAGAFTRLEATLCFLTTGAVPSGALTADQVATAEGVQEAAVVQQAAETFDDVMLTNLSGFFAAEGFSGCRIEGNRSRGVPAKER